MLFLLLIPFALVLIFMLSLGVAAARGDRMSARAWARRHEGNER